MTAEYHVRVSKDYLVFSAAHFITIGENICECLHGHNYRVAAEVYGPLDKHQCVIDFILLRDTLQEIVLSLDHHVLLPTEHLQIRVSSDEQNVVATFEDRHWSFPRGDCVLLPVANTTAEQLADYIGRQLLATLQRQKLAPQRLRIEVDECYGQLGICDLTGG